MNLYTRADRYRALLVARERATAGELVRDYGKAYQRIMKRLKVLSAQIEAAGPNVRPSWLYEYNRLTTFQRQVADEMNAWAQTTRERIELEQIDFGELANRHTLNILQVQALSVLTNFRRIDSRAFLASRGFTQPGSPLRQLLDSFGETAGQDAADALSQAVLLGIGPRGTAALVQQALGVNLNRALTISRTETLRAYREAQRGVFQENSDIIQGWIWRSARNLRTCPSCWAMDGTVHTIDERLDDHPNGRCYAVALLRPDLASERPDMGNGRDAFARLGQDGKLQILGPSKYAAWQTGAVTLDENPVTGIVGRKYDPVWGTMRYERSLKELGLDASHYLQLAESLLK